MSATPYWIMHALNAAILLGVLWLLLGCTSHPNPLTPEQHAYCQRHPHEVECSRGRF